jgi:hypothetical protein
MLGDSGWAGVALNPQEMLCPFTNMFLFMLLGCKPQRRSATRARSTSTTEIGMCVCLRDVPPDCLGFFFFFVYVVVIVLVIFNVIVIYYSFAFFFQVCI